MKVLFVCTGNTCRSPMAEGILRKIGKDKNLNIESMSAGIFANQGEEASRHAISSLRDMEIDIEDHLSQKITDELLEESDLILTMTMGHKMFLVEKYPEKKYKIFLLNEYAFGKEVDINDPYGGDRFQYDRARDEILRAIEKIYEHIKNK